METYLYIEKFKKLLHKIIVDKYDLKRHYREKLLKCLNTSNIDGKTLLDTPVFSDLIFRSLKGVENISISNQIFTTELVTKLFENELQFNNSQSLGIDLVSLHNCVANNLKFDGPSTDLHLACIKLLTTQISHYSGLKAVLASKVWKEVLKPGIHSKPSHVAKAAYNFISKLVWNLEDYEEESELRDVTMFVVSPILNSPYVTLDVLDTEEDRAYSESVLSSLNALNAIVKETDRLINSKIIMSHLKCFLFYGESMQKIYFGSRDPQLVCLVTFICFEFFFATIVKTEMRDGKSPSDLLNLIIVMFLNKFSIMLSRKYMVYAIMEFTAKVNLFWMKTMTNYPTMFESSGKKYEIDNQFMMFMLWPMLTYSYYNMDHEEMKTVIEEYQTKLLKLLTEHVIKCLHIYGSLIIKRDLKQLTIQNIKDVLRLKGLLKAEQAALIFQSLYFLLEIYIPKVENGNLFLRENPFKTHDDLKLLTLLLEAMKMLLTEHKIHWYENIEIFGLQTNLINLLNLNILPTKQIFQALELIELSIKKFLSPDMAMLVESKSGSTLEQTAAIMKSYIKHDDWEVRDSALSILLTCTEIAFVKYVPLQKLISENQLIILASEAAFFDPEDYVQATALKCLAAATKIGTIWQNLLTHNQNLYTQLIFMMRHNPEDILRTAAVNILTQIYVNHNTAQAFNKHLYNVMASAALDDLSFEVQLAALVFWEKVVQRQLTDKGMIDGTFPKITFSKEKRKIVVLDYAEVTRLLTCVMHDLSDIGCLTVLHECINQDFNVHVMEQAYKITRELVTILNSQKYERVPQNALTYPMDEDFDIKDNIVDMALDLTYVPDKEYRDKVIDEIMDTEFSDLIMNFTQHYVHHSKTQNNLPMYAAEKEKIHPNKFLEDFKGTDYSNIIRHKIASTRDDNNLFTLLDEILEDNLGSKYTQNCIE